MANYSVEALQGLSRHIRACKEYSLLVGDADNVDAAADELQRLRAENANLKASLAVQSGARLDAEDARDALQADALRYRWLRDNDGSDAVIVNWNIGHDWVSSENLDAAIDSAIEEAKKC